MKKVTIHDIAQKLNITASTVSRALNENPRISEDTRERVRKMAEELHYEPNLIASALRSGKTQLIGMLVPTINRAFFSAIVRGVEEVANSLGYHVIVSQSNENFRKEQNAIKAFLNIRVEGVIASVGKNTEKFDHFEQVLERKLPLVLFDRTTEKFNTDQVVIDDFEGGYKATAHLIEQGCQRIAHFTNAKTINIYSERYKGYQKALEDNSLPFDQDLVLKGGLQLEDGRRHTAFLLQSGRTFDGIFSSSDYAVIGAMQQLKDQGIGVPDDVALVGFSNEPFTSFTQPALTTVNQFPIAMGHTAAELFFKALKKPIPTYNPRKKMIAPELIIRESSQKTLKKI